MSKLQFQQDGAEKAYQSLFVENNNRYLLADEVGLGKTITAATVIAKKALAAKKEGQKNIHIGYICGNMALALQNIKKLRRKILEVLEESGEREAFSIEDKQAESLSLSFLNYASPEEESSAVKIFISVLTPAKTICVTSPGTAMEWAYAYWLLTGENGDKIIEDTCNTKNNRTENLSFEKEKAKAQKRLNKLIEENKENYVGFKAEFNKLLEEEWKANSEKIISNCIKKSISQFYYKRWEDFCRAGYIFKKICEMDKTYPFNSDKIDAKYIHQQISEQLKDDEVQVEAVKEKINVMESDGTCYDQELEYYRNTIKENYKGSKRSRESYIRFIWELLQNEDRKKFLARLYYHILKENKDQIGECTKNILSAVINMCQGKNTELKEGNKIEVVEDIQALTEKEKSIKSDVEKVFRETCIKEYFKLARKCMAVASVTQMKMDLFIADEIQNYSDLFNTRISKSEMGLVVNRIIQGDQKILMMSATPFRYHSKMNSYENTNKDKDADDYNEEEIYNAAAYVKGMWSEETDDTMQHYLASETDIYKEFLMIMGYLNERPDFRDWVKSWEDQNQKKCIAIKEGKKEDYKASIKAQTDMLKKCNISRVERYMSGEDIRFANENIEVFRDNKIPFQILQKELQLVPRSTIEYIAWEDVKGNLTNGDYLICEEEDNWYIYGVDKKIWGIYDFDDDELVDENRLVWYEELPVWKREEEENNVQWVNCNDAKVLRQFRFDMQKDAVRQDYMKSTPALFSYKKNIYKKMENLTDKTGRNTISKARVMAYEKLFALTKDDVENDKEDKLMYHSRLAQLFYVLFEEEELHKLLFIPPAANKGLAGCFEGKWGASKRLFFTDYTMTPQSLSTLITYESTRRVVEDLKKRYLKDHEDVHIPYLSEEDKEYPNKCLNIRDLFTWWSESTSPREKLIGRLYERDKELYLPDRKGCYMGSPYAYAKSRPKLFGDREYEIEIFCKAYFKYMSRVSSLQVILAYYSGEGSPKSVYDAIFQYGKDGDIWGVFDEYAEYISRVEYKNGGKESFAEAFSGVMNITLSSLGVTVKEGASINMQTHFACGHYAGASEGNTSAAKAFERKITRFNSPFRPFQFISTSIGQEGFDFHVYCRKVVHWSLEYNPVKFEQREGRVNRYQGYANRLKLWSFMEKNKIIFEGWAKAFEELKNRFENRTCDSKGLFPDYVIPGEDNFLVRESYYYPGSFELYKFQEVLQTVGYYRSLLGQLGGDSFEDAFRRFTEGEKNLAEYFINLYPVRPMD